MEPAGRAQAAGIPSGPPDRSEGTPMAASQPLNLLVVDRDAEVRRTLGDWLARQGHRPVGLADPSRATAELRAERYPIVILDVSPGTGGREALAAIRAFDRDVCVIATCAVESVELAVETMKHRAFHFLQKPLDADRVLAVVREAIRERGLVVDLETRLNGEIGSRVRGRRHESTLTLKQLANRTGLSISLISQIELGKSAASMSTVVKLASALGVRPTYFFETL